MSVGRLERLGRDTGCRRLLADHIANPIAFEGAGGDLGEDPSGLAVAAAAAAAADPMRLTVADWIEDRCNSSHAGSDPDLGQHVSTELT